MKKSLYVMIMLATLFTKISLSAVTLEESIKLSLKNNKDLLKAKEEVEIYKQSYKDVKGNLFPQLSLSGGYQYKYNKLPKSLVPEIPPLSAMLTPLATSDDQIIAGYIDNAFTNLVPERESKTYNLAGNLNFKQVVFMGGKLIHGINIAKKLYHLQEKKYYLTRQEIIYKTIDLYYKTKLAKKVADIQKDAYDLANKHFKQVQKMYDEGLVSEYDLLRAKLEVRKLEPLLLEANKNRDLSKESLAKFIGIDDMKFTLDTDFEMPKIDSIGLNEALQKGLKQRMELKLADLAVEVNKVQLKYQKGNFLPNIGISGEYGYYGSTENSFKKDNFGTSYQIGVGFSMPLFTGFSNTAKKAKAKHSLKESILTYKNLQDMIKLDIKNSYKQLQKDIKAVKVQKENVKLSQKAYQIAQTRYQNQLSDQLEIFDAQLQLKSAKLNYLNSIYHVIIDYNKFKKSIGENLYKEVKDEK